MCVYRSAIPAVLNSPVGSAESVVESIRHRVSSLALELRGALGVGERLVTQGPKIEVV